MAQEIRITLSTTIPFSTQGHSTSAAVTNILEQAKAAIETTHPGVTMELGVIVVTPRPVKAPKGSVMPGPIGVAAGAKEPLGQQSADQAPTDQPADTKTESAESLLTPPKSFAEMAAAAKAKKTA